MELNEKSKKLQTLFEQTPVLRNLESIYDQLREVQPVLESAKSSGYTYKQMVDVLGKSGIEVKLHQLTGFFRDVLKVPPRTRKPRRGRKKMKHKVIDVGGRGTSKSNGLQERDNKLVNKTITSGEPKKGFRVAKDDL